MAAINPGTSIVTKIIFPVAELEAAAAFYRSLGFTVEAFDGGGYAWVTHRGQEILHLSEVPDLDRTANRAAGYFHVQDAADWHTAWAASGIEIGELIDHPWQMREFTLRDLDSNLLRLGQNL